MSNFHKPVLLAEVLEGLKVKQGDKYIDATLGGGGHSFGRWFQGLGAGNRIRFHAWH